MDLTQDTRAIDAVGNDVLRETVDLVGRTQFLRGADLGGSAGSGLRRAYTMLARSTTWPNASTTVLISCATRGSLGLRS